MKSDTQDFAEKLLSVPPVPDDILPAVHKRIRRRIAVVRAASALAIVVALAAGLVTYSLRPAPALQPVAAIEAADTTQSDIDNELQIVCDYINGTDIESEAIMYALVDLTVFEPVSQGGAQ